MFRLDKIFVATRSGVVKVYDGKTNAFARYRIG